MLGRGVAVILLNGFRYFPCATCAVLSDPRCSKARCVLCSRYRLHFLESGRGHRHLQPCAESGPTRDNSDSIQRQYEVNFRSASAPECLQTIAIVTYNWYFHKPASTVRTRSCAGVRRTLQCL